jgi:hypothetical protein
MRAWSKYLEDINPIPVLSKEDIAEYKRYLDSIGYKFPTTIMGNFKKKKPIRKNRGKRFNSKA